ncbi:MAG: HlyD family efflux transporter periplasmic adaptor subunit [Gammaproteobacteria bacterium]|nr:MAG: HlyD family efflux transporter periplasmic adaptor subunit [Gammaproteobacteria bacterium]
MTWRAATLAPLLAALLATSACDSIGAADRVVGQLESDRIELSAEFAEPITERLVVEGQQVRRGERLMQQDTSRITLRIAEAEAVLGRNRARLDELVRGPRRERIVASRALLRGAEQEAAFRAEQYARAQTLLEQELASPDVRDQARAALDGANANLRSLQAQLEELLNGTTAEELRQAEESVRQAQATVAALRVDLSRYQAVAPMDGVVDSILFDPGERPAPGVPMLIMLPAAQPYARVYVPERLKVLIAPGMAARVFVDGLDAPLEGRVRWVASEAAFTPYFALTERDRGRLSFLAKIDLQDTGKRLPDGVPVEVEFLLDDQR